MMLKNQIMKLQTYKMYEGEDTVYVERDDVLKILEQQPCEDWYDVPSDEMTLEQARQAVKDLRKKLAEYLEQQLRDCKTCKHSDKGNCAGTEECHECMWESKYEQLPCEDCISRDEVLKDQLSVYTKEYGEIDVVAVEYIESLPSVTPSYNSINTELKPCEDVLDEIITQIEQMRDKDKIAEYPYNRCIRIVEGYKNGE